MNYVYMLVYLDVFIFLILMKKIEKIIQKRIKGVGVKLRIKLFVITGYYSANRWLYLNTNYF